MQELRRTWKLNTVLTAGTTTRDLPNERSLLVLRTGLEPVTYGLEIRCSIQLSYRSMWITFKARHIISLLEDKQAKRKPVEYI